MSQHQVGQATKEQIEEGYAFTEEYRGIDEGAEPVEILDGTMPLIDEEIGKLYANSREVSPHPPSWRTDKQPYPEALRSIIDNVLINCQRTRILERLQEP